MRTNGEWRVWKGSRRGSLHQLARLPNQDAVSARLWHGGGLCVVADGVGSAPLSHIGAHTLCRVITKSLSGYTGKLTQELLDSIHLDWLTALPEDNPHHFATTCRLILMSRGKAYLAQVGDGGTLLLCHDRFITFDEEGKHAFSNMTSAVSSFPAAWNMMELDLNELKAAFLMTDGLYDDIADSGNAEGFANDLYNSYRSCSSKTIRRDVLSWLRGWPACGMTDDMTICALIRTI